MNAAKAAKVIAQVGGAGYLATRMIVARADKVRRQRAPFTRFWERTTLDARDRLADLRRQGRPDPFIYVALGDSAAQGLGASSEANGYVPRIAAMLEASTGREVLLFNLSLSGAVTYSVLATQLPHLAGLEAAGQPIVPDLVTLDIGGNDVNERDLTVEAFEGHMDAVLSAIPVPAVVADVPSYGILKVAPRAKEMSAAISRSIARQAAAGRDIRPAKIEEMSEQISPADYAFKYHAPDMFHPNDRWYGQWAQEFADQIAPMLGLEPITVADCPPWSGARH